MYIKLSDLQFPYGFGVTDYSEGSEVFAICGFRWKAFACSFLRQVLL